MADRRSALEDVVVTDDFWKNKKVLITGHTGFKGSWTSLWLQSLGAKVIGYALPPPTEPSLFEEAAVSSGMTSIIGDVRDIDAVTNLFKEHSPDIVIHMAAQSLVRYSYSEPVETYATNVMGTLNVLEAMRITNTARAALLVTSDKCYENRELTEPFCEDEPMGGHDPYSSSKACAEILIASYRNAYFPPDEYPQHRTAVASVRAGNVIGGGDWAEDRLVPDIIRAFKRAEPVQIRHPDAVRPWQHVLEPIAGYIELAEKLFDDGPDYAEAWNFGPCQEDARPVRWVVERMVDGWDHAAGWSFDDAEQPHEAGFLKLDISKVCSRLSWRPKWELEEALDKTISWYRAEMARDDLREVCLAQIGEYTATH